jgi:cob(I)alamin adenosyltransferase
MTVSETTDEQPEKGPAPSWMPYTRTGDSGATTLGDFTRVNKTDPRVVAYGDCDETAAFLGLTVTLSTDDLTNAMVRLITRVQNDLVDVGADITAPVNENDTGHLRIDWGYVARLERAAEYFNADLSQPSSFVVPGGTTTAATLHYAYTLARRAERSAQALIEQDPHRTNPLTRTYLNRLGNLLLVMARYANLEHGDTPWEPGLTAQLAGAELWEPHPDESSEY